MLEMEIRPGNGFLIEEKFLNTRKPSHQQVWGKFSNLRGQHYREEKEINKTTDYMPKGNSQQRSSPDAHIRCHQHAGLNGEEWAALFRVRTGPERLEGNLRELTGDSNPNCGRASERERRERGRENYPRKSPNLRHCQAANRTKD